MEVVWAGIGKKPLRPAPSARRRKIADGKVEPAGRRGDLPAELHLVEQHIAARRSIEPTPGLDPVEHRLDIHLSGRRGTGAHEGEDGVGAIGPLVDIPGVASDRHADELNRRLPGGIP
jgi:hypothetical protein